MERKIVKTLGDKFSGVELIFTSKGMEVFGWYDTCVGIVPENNFLSWDEIIKIYNQLTKRKKEV